MPRVILDSIKLKINTKHHIPISIKLRIRVGNTNERESGEGGEREEREEKVCTWRQRTCLLSIRVNTPWTALPLPRPLPPLPHQIHCSWVNLSSSAFQHFWKALKVVFNHLSPKKLNTTEITNTSKERVLPTSWTDGEDKRVPMHATFCPNFSSSFLPSIPNVTAQQYD